MLPFSHDHDIFLDHRTDFFALFIGRTRFTRHSFIGNGSHNGYFMLEAILLEHLRSELVQG